MTQEEKQLDNHEIDIPEFLNDKVKTIISMPEPEFKKFTYRFYKDGVKDGTAIGIVKGFILGALFTVLINVIYVTCFASHILPMAGP